MARVVPSQVVELIDQMFPQAKDESRNNFYLENIHLPFLSAIIALADQIPSELINLDAPYHVEYEASKAAMKSVMLCWIGPGGNRLTLHDIGISSLNPLTLLRRALKHCPDAFPLQSTTELNFIEDNELRENLRLDLSAANQALTDGEWKAATVLAGSIIEALLLWALQQITTAEIQSIVSSLVQQKTLRKDPGPKLDSWTLHELIEVSKEIKIIKQDTANAARLAKEFRNLIHPGRNIRLGQTCNRATALSAVAAVEHVIGDLK